LERPHFVSELDNHLYAIYANDCVLAGNHPEGIPTLQTLVKNNPDYIQGWLQLAALFNEIWQLQQALGTLKDLATLHPTYREDQIPFQDLLKKCASQRSVFFTPSPTNNQTSKNQRAKGTSEHTTKDFSLH